MKKIINAVVLITLILLPLSLFGCSEKYSRDVSLAIIGGQHANMKSCNLPSIIFESGENAFLTNEDRVISILGIVPDGNPIENYSCIRDNFFENYNSAVDAERWETVQKDVINFINDFSKQIADDEEVDTLTAFYNVGNVFSTQKDCTKCLLVFDSGLCTKGALNFVENSYYKEILDKETEPTEKEIDAIISELKKNKELPNLTNVKIRWYGIGMTYGKQAELTKLQINNLQAIWDRILKESRADVEFFNINPSLNSFNSEILPNVSVVMFDKATLLGEEELGFQPDKSNFLEGTEEKRNILLEKFVSEGKTNGILLVGTASTGGSKNPNGVGFNLSLERAEAVKKELIKLGIPSDKIKAIGLGTRSHKYNPREFINGTYYSNSSAAKENRSVYIMLLDSNEAKMFFAEYDILVKEGIL